MLLIVHSLSIFTQVFVSIDVAVVVSSIFIFFFFTKSCFCKMILRLLPPQRHAIHYYSIRSDSISSQSGHYYLPWVLTSELFFPSVWGFYAGNCLIVKFSFFLFHFFILFFLYKTMIKRNLADIEIKNKTKPEQTKFVEGIFLLPNHHNVTLIKIFSVESIF